MGGFESVIWKATSSSTVVAAVVAAPVPASAAGSRVESGVQSGIGIESGAETVGAVQTDKRHFWCKGPARRPVS